MKMRNICLVFLPFCALSAYADAITLGTAGSFGVLAGSTVTNTGPSDVIGDIGVSPGSAITGFPSPGTLTGTEYAADPGGVAAQAESDLTTAYNTAKGEACPGGNNLTGQDLGTLGAALTPGVYCFNSSAQLTGTLTLSGTGDYIFQIGSTLTTASGSNVLLENGAQGQNVFWQVGSSATLNTTTSFEGNILALDSITLDTGTNIGCGSALARTAAVTMDTNDVTVCASPVGASPEPRTAALLGMGLLLGLIVWRRDSWKQTA